ncbi:MAG TPA: hypothetical protein VI197_21370, partial [Polyangiaceae bacterium]
MKARPPLLTALGLRGLELAPSQRCGAIRIVPLLRREIRSDLRLFKRSYAEDVMVVSLDGELMAPGIKYLSYVPHGLVVSWSTDGTAAAAFGTQLDSRDGKHFGKGPFSVRVAHRMARREDKNRLRLLPLHLAMEGFLALHFGGPEVAWSEYSRHALSKGLDPRGETAVPGSWIPGLEDALRIFEIHEGQVGVLLFVADALASAFVVPHPDDYGALHRTLLEDFYGTLLVHYGLHATTAPMAAVIDETRVSSIGDLRRELASMRSEWTSFHERMAAGLVGRDLHSERVYRAGPFQLQRFATALERSAENHIGEAIVRDSGELEYLKTFRLSAAQTRRAFLLSQLASQHWNLD